MLCDDISDSGFETWISTYEQKGSMSMQRILLNNYYALDWYEFCVLLETDQNLSDEEIRELVVAVQFLYEEYIDESSNPSLLSIANVLKHFYGFRVLSKTNYQDDIRTVLQEVRENGITSMGICTTPYIYIDLYSDREHFCGPGNPERLFAKWIRDDEKQKILDLLNPELS